jgi:hypothetical protein
MRLHQVSGDIDGIVKRVGLSVDGEEDLKPFLVTHIDRDDRRLLQNMEGHVLQYVPSALFGRESESDAERKARYELIAALMVNSGFPAGLLNSSRRWQKWRFESMSAFFQIRDMNHLNEQCISCWARRLLCFFGCIQKVKVPGQELRDNFAVGNSGMTTENLLDRQLRSLERGTY